MKVLFLSLLIFFGCSTTPEGETITYSCPKGNKITCQESECEDKCRNYESYDDPYTVRQKSDSDNPFVLDGTEEQVEFGHGN